VDSFTILYIVGYFPSVLTPFTKAVLIKFSSYHRVPEETQFEESASEVLRLKKDIKKLREYLKTSVQVMIQSTKGLTSYQAYTIQIGAKVFGEEDKYLERPSGRHQPSQVFISIIKSISGEIGRGNTG